MAADKLVDSSQLNGALTSTANAIRGKTGGSASLAWDATNGFKAAVESIVTLSEGSADADAAAGDILLNKTAYVQGSKVTGTIPSKAAATITPTTANQTIASGQYLSGAQTIAGDANLRPDYIKSGVSIFGVTGSYTGVAPVITETTDSHGGTVVDITTDAEYSWKGPAVEFVQNLGTLDVALADTAFATWTPKTTTTTVRSASTLTTFVADMASYDYIIEWEAWIKFEYLEGATLKGIPIMYGNTVYTGITKRPTTTANLRANIYDGNVSSTRYSGLTLCYNASGVETLGTATTYGVVCVGTEATFSSATSNSPTVTVKTPAINARCNDAVMSISSVEYIDKTNSIFHMSAKLYRCKRGSYDNGLITTTVNLLNAKGA